MLLHKPRIFVWLIGKAHYTWKNSSLLLPNSSHNVLYTMKMVWHSCTYLGRHSHWTIKLGLWMVKLGLAFWFAVMLKLRDFYFNAILPELAVPTLHKGGICVSLLPGWRMVMPGREIQKICNPPPRPVPILGHSLTEMSTHSLVLLP